jgi:hypothetical protein
MGWKEDRDALVAQTMAFVKNARDEHVKFKPNLGIVEQVLAEPPKPVAAFAPMIWPISEREEIKKRVASFKAHQQRLQREREDYCARTLAKARDQAP